MSLLPSFAYLIDSSLGTKKHQTKTKPRQCRGLRYNEDLEKGLGPCRRKQPGHRVPLQGSSLGKGRSAQVTKTLLQIQEN